MKVLIAYDVFSGCAWYRCVLPGHAASLAGHDVRLRQGAVTHDDIEWCDTFAVQRMWHPEAMAAIREAKRLGKLTVYDLDDDLWSIAPHNNAHEHWALHSGEAAACIAECDRVTTTQPYLANTLRQHNADVRVIPNALAPDWRHGTKTHRGLVIGWAGSPSHVEDMEQVAPTLKAVLDAHPDVTLEIAGCDKAWIAHDQVRYVGTQDIGKYHLLLSRFDIGIAPLNDTHFNRSKSDLKVLEYAGLGIPCVASKVGPYTHTPALLASSPIAWRRHLTRLIEDESERRRVGERAKKWARTTNDTLPMWVDAWTR